MRREESISTEPMCDGTPASPAQAALSQVHCLCGQAFSIPAHRPWALSCHACGRKLSVLDNDKIVELAGPKGEHHEAVSEKLAGSRLPPSSQKVLRCNQCGTELHAPCAWCGQAHCWLHAPKGHPNPRPGLGEPEWDWRIPFVLYLLPALLVAIIYLLEWLLAP